MSWAAKTALVLPKPTMMPSCQGLNATRVAKDAASFKILDDTRQNLVVISLPFVWGL